MVIKVFHYSNLAFVKSNLIAKKIIQLYLNYYRISRIKINKVEFFCNIKDETPKLNESFVVYEFICPGCNDNYVGKTERTLNERCAEHVWDEKDSVVFNHFNECIGVQHMFEMGKLTPSLLTNNTIDDEFDLRSSHVNLILLNNSYIDMVGASRRFANLIIKHQ